MIGRAAIFRDNTPSLHYTVSRLTAVLAKSLLCQITKDEELYKSLLTTHAWVRRNPARMFRCGANCSSGSPAVSGGARGLPAGSLVTSEGITDLTIWPLD
jgi:hypothetical protein